jgi:TPR repeat protein
VGSQSRILWNTSAITKSNSVLLLAQGVAQDDVEAAKYFKLSADQGNALGQKEYGIALRDGRGVPKNPGLAAHYLLLASSQGVP